MKLPLPTLRTVGQFLKMAVAIGLLPLLLQTVARAATFHVSVTGNDGGDGSVTAPFATIMRAQTAASTGDTVLIRGGTYASFTIAFTDSNYNYVHRLSKSGITYAAYPGEIPVFDFSSVPTNLRVCGFHVTGSGLVVRGIQVTGVLVGSQKQSECFRIDGSAAYVDFYDCVAHDTAANGFYFTNRSRGSCTRCDAYNNIGTNGEAIGNTDGFGAHGNGVVFRYCRSWNNSDDGYDCISSAGANTFDHCWAFNMRAGGDSNGFKVGGWGTDSSTVLPVPLPVHTVSYCLAANNNAHGFYANHQPGQAAVWTHNTSYNNSAGNFDMLERTSDMTADIAGFREVLHQNLAYSGTAIKDDNNPPEAVSDNSWNRSGATVDAADFQSVDVTQLSLPRSAGNNLPFITFMHLTANSDLVGLGCFDPPPSAPTSVQAAWASSSQVNLSWTGSPGATTYYVKRAIVSGGPYTTIAARLTGTTYADTTVSKGAIYYYRVSAMDDISFDEGVSGEVTAVNTPAAITGISSDTGRSASDGITNDTTLVFAGTAAPNSTLVITRSSVGAIGNSVADASGGWSFDYAGTVLPEGTFNVQVTATDPSNGTRFTSDPFVVVVDTTAPAAPAITTVANIADSVVVSGTAEPLSEVTVTQDDSLILGSAITAANGSWSVTRSSSPPGSHRFTAIATDPAGNVGVPSVPFAIDTTITPPVIAEALTDFGGLASGGFTRDATISIVGTASPGNSVALTQNGSGVIGSVVADVNGNWTFDSTGTPLADGSYQFAATASNGAASSAASNVFSLTVDTVAPANTSTMRQSPTSDLISSAITSAVFRVTFSESVSGVEVDDFVLTTSGSASGNISSVSASTGTVFDVTVNSLVGSGTLRLDLKLSGTAIVDAAGNAAGGFAAGESYTRVLSTVGNGTWIQLNSGGLWSDPGNWLGAVIPDGTTYNANFNTLELTASNAVRLDSPRAANSLTFGDTNTATAGSWLIDNNGNSANALTLAGAVPTITVNTLGAGAIATVAARIIGTSGLTKAGPGTLALSGANTLSGALNTTAGTLRLDTGSSFNSSTIAVNAAGAVLRVNGGTLTATGTATITGATNTAIIVDAGSASLPMVTFTNASGGLFRINGGNVNVNTLTIPRSSDAAISYATGFVVTGGDSTAGTITLGTGNSNALMSIEGGKLTVNGVLTVGNQTTVGRGGAIRVIGGTFVSTDTAQGIVLAKTNGSVAANVSLATFSAGVSTVEKITLGFDSAVNAGSATVTIDGGTLYLGAGGIVKNGTAGLATALNFSNGVLGAKADWFTAQPINFPANGNIAIKTADAAEAPFNIALNGVLSGAGGFTKTGAGTLVLSGANTFAGVTTVNAGTLAVDGSVAAGGVLVVNVGGRLAGAGMINRTVMLNQGGVISPAAAMPGTLTATALTWNRGGKLLVDVGTAKDTLVIAGALTKGGGGSGPFEIAVVPGAGFGAGTYTLATFGSTTFSAADFAVTGLGSAVANVQVQGTLLTLTVEGAASPFTTWANSFGLPAEQQGPLADPDGDGVANVLEFATGSDPTAAGGTASGSTSVTTVDGERYPTFTFQRRQVLGDVTLEVRVSTNLDFSGTLGIVELSVTDRGDGTDTVVVRSAVSLSEQPSQFFRLKATVL